MTVYFNETLPILTVSVQAADRAVAARIATAAVRELARYLKSIAAQEKVPDARRLTIEGLGRARSATQRKGPGKALAILAFVLVLGIWCSVILVVTRLAERWREAAAQEAGGVPTPPPLEAPATPPTAAAWPAPSTHADPAPLAPREPGAPPHAEPLTSTSYPMRSAEPDPYGEVLREPRTGPRSAADARPDPMALASWQHHDRGATTSTVSTQLVEFLECPLCGERGLQIVPSGYPGGDDKLELSCRCGAGFPLDDALGNNFRGQ